MRAVADYGRPLIDDPDRLAGVCRIGVDETAFLAANGAPITRSSSPALWTWPHCGSSTSWKGGPERP